MNDMHSLLFSHIGVFPRLCGLIFCLILLTGLRGELRTTETKPSDEFSLLVFSKTEGFRHTSIESGVAAISALGSEHSFSVDASEDASVFSSDNLSRYDAVVFLNTTGDVLNASQQAAFEGYIQSGGGFAGIHAAADTEYDWTWYGELVGGYFNHHPEVQEAKVHVLDGHHPSTKGLPARWIRTDEWYDYRANPRGKVHVLATLSEQSYEGGLMGSDHPIVWAHQFDGGRSWYTGLGHTEESYEEPLYLQHLLGGIRWAAGAEDGDVAATITGAFKKVVLDENTTYPMELDIAADGRVFFIERDGSVKLWNPDTETTRMAGFIPVTTKIEDGLLGLALDPNFSNNNWLYLYYSPRDESPNRLSRFTMNGDELDMKSEIVVLEVPVQRLRCCHSAGAVEFGPGNNLYLSTGENAGGWNNQGQFEEGLYGWDAFWDNERTTANTNDLRGKILRIHPEMDGSYTIPKGNLFEDNDLLTRPEIYTMGHRNPFRFDVDPKTGWIYWGDVGPGNNPDEERAPTGYEEVNQAKGPGFFGWPYFVGPNAPYRDFDPKTQKLGEWANPRAPVNDSPNNTGLRQLPPAQQAFISYFYTPSEEFPELGAGGMSAAAGPIYRYDPKTAGPRGLPAYFDGSVFIYEFMRNWIMEVKLDELGELMEINPLFPDEFFARPIDVEVGPDGRLYVLEWGLDFWGQSREGQLTRLDYYGSQEQPSAPTANSNSPEESPVLFSWPLTGSFFDYGHPMLYRLDIPEDEGNELTLQSYLGHDTHTHELHIEHTAEGQITVMPDISHAPYVIDEFVELEARYRRNDDSVLTERIRLHPRRWQAENYSNIKDAQVIVTNNRQWPYFAEVTEVFLRAGDGDHVTFENVNLMGIDGVKIRLEPEAAGSVEIHLGSPDGLLLAKSTFAPPADTLSATEMTGDPPDGEGAPRFQVTRIEGWTEIPLSFSAPDGLQDLYVIFKSSESGKVAKFDWIEFQATN